MKVSFLLVLIVLVSGIGLWAGAQKLPNVQQNSLRAPVNAKADGKLIEWDDSFQAHNRATEIDYTIANDDTHLYLVIRANIADVINKIVRNGITFTIQKSGKKTDNDGVSITYPVFAKDNRPSINIKSNHEINEQLIDQQNKELSDKSKDIVISGISGLESPISVYNENGIKAGQSFNAKGDYCYELSIDLKILGISVTDAIRLAYHITLNGTGDEPVNGKPVSISYGGAPQAITLSAMLPPGMANPTDFWGEYTLAKK